MLSDGLIWGFSHHWPATLVDMESRWHSQIWQEERIMLGVHNLGDLRLMGAMDVKLRGGV